jgi:hypothetical protein
MLKEDTITFGKYNNKNLSDMLKDRNYCKWILNQEWFQNNYEYLYNRVKEYNPRTYFLNTASSTSNNFINDYIFFNLLSLEHLKLKLNNDDKICYTYYLRMIQELKNKIINNLNENCFNIKAPTKWLKNFEKEYNLPRSRFKQFLYEYDLPNIPYIVEDIKKEGGIEYKGARSFNIAKERSQSQEAFWECILKSKYGEDLGTQFKFQKCFFDFINISTNTIFECKLGLKDFNEEQYKKYLLTLKNYRIIYLIGFDCVINIQKKEIYTLNDDKYTKYVSQIPLMKSPSKFDILLSNFKVLKVEDLASIFGFNN